ncbi:hypothetical protein ACJX0J_037261, partial [Zea mays]
KCAIVLKNQNMTICAPMKIVDISLAAITCTFLVSVTSMFMIPKKHCVDTKKTQNEATFHPVETFITRELTKVNDNGRIPMTLLMGTCIYLLINSGVQSPIKIIDFFQSTKPEPMLFSEEKKP